MIRNSMEAAKVVMLEGVPIISLSPIGTTEASQGGVVVKSNHLTKYSLA